MELLNIKITGNSPLIMHGDRYANPLDPMTKEHKVLTGKRKKTDEDQLLIALSEMRGAMYWNSRLGPYLPGANIRSAIVNGGKLNKLGKQIQRSTMMAEPEVPLEYEGSRDRETLIQDPQFQDCRGVVVSGRRIMRYRPIFREWAAQFAIYYEPSAINPEDIELAATNAGLLIGIGDFRPERGGMFGRFSVEIVR